MKKLVILISTVASISGIAQLSFDLQGNRSDHPLSASNKPAPGASGATKKPAVVHKIPSPVTGTGDIAFDGVDLWVEGFQSYKLYKISRVNGAIIKTIPTGIMRPYGLEFANGFLWVTDADNRFIQKVDTANGNVIASFPTPAKSSGSYPGGLAWDGQNLWNNDPMGPNITPIDSIYQIDTTGLLIQSHKHFGNGYMSGLAWDGQFLWSSENWNLKIYKIDVSTFTAVDTILAPTNFPNGLAFDGQYLWVSGNPDHHDSIFKLDISGVITGITNAGSIDAPGLFVYPNPVSHELNIVAEGTIINTEYSIADETGRLVMSGKLSERTTKLNIEHLSEGVYFFQAGNTTSQSFKILKK